jgi:hypothetical protein
VDASVMIRGTAAPCTRRTPLAAASPICFNPRFMSREAHSATTYLSSAALYDFGFAYRYAWRFS